MQLDSRMKKYECVAKTNLLSRTPVIIRIDGKAFHTFTRGMVRPFDRILIKTMQDTMLYLCQNIQGCLLGYTQSDEITLLLQDWYKLETCAWFDNETQKICSISASMATLGFNTAFIDNVSDNFSDLGNVFDDTVYTKKYNKALFDSRCFNVPFAEVCNNFIWRQQDATRNSILSLGQSLFSHKKMQGVKCNELQNKMLIEKDVNWNDLPTTFKRGSCAVKRDGKWVIDNEIPIFTENREYIEDLLKVEE